MPEIKTFISMIAVVLTFVGYIPYLLDTIKKKTSPHIYTWFIWGFVNAIAYALQVSGGAGVGSWMALTATLITFVIFIFGLRGGKKDITRIDSVFLILAIAAIYLWLIAKQPIWSIALVTSIDMLGFVPTIRKSWNKPYSETLFTYELNAFRHGVSLFALQQYNIVTWLYPATWMLACFLFSLMLIFRRKQIQ